MTATDRLAWLVGCRAESIHLRGARHGRAAPDSPGRQPVLHRLRATAQLWPVLVLHLALMPLNLHRLRQLRQQRQARKPTFEKAGARKERPA